MKTFISLLLIALAPIIYAQPIKASKAAKYNLNIAKDSINGRGGKVYVYQEKSDDVKFLGRICIGNVGISQCDPITWSFGLGADYLFKGLGSLHADYNAALLFDFEHLMSNNPNQTNLSKTDIRRYHTYEFGGSIFLSEQHTHKKHKIVLKTHHGMRSDIEYFIMSQLPCRKIMAVRGGYWGNNSGVNTDMNANFNKLHDGSGAVTSTDGTVLSNTYFTNAYTRGGYIGISKTTIFSTVTKNTYREGVFVSKGINELYADLLVGATTFDAIIDSNGSHKIVANKSGSFQTIPVGARVGVTHSKENSGRAVARVELGYRPGLKGQGLYFSFGWSLAIMK